MQSERSHQMGDPRTYSASGSSSRMKKLARLRLLGETRTCSKAEENTREPEVTCSSEDSKASAG